MKVCVVGSGAREHALAEALGRSAEVVVTPGNPGIAGWSREGHRLSSTTVAPEEIEADLFVIGPEAPLVAGLADRLRSNGRLVLGPGGDGAHLEGSKAFMKELACAASVPSARFGVFERLDEAEDFLARLPGPYVVKTDGLAAGKGVLVTEDLAVAKMDAKSKLSGASFGAAGHRVVIEEGLSGPELSLLVLCDGRRALALPAAQDFKRLEEADRGPNTGGMGAYSPVPIATKSVIDEIMERIVEPTIGELVRRGIDYRGVLYAGCILTEEGPKLIEYNVRFGDPETQPVLARLEGDVAELLHQCASGKLANDIAVSSRAAVCVVLAAAGYPVDPRRGDAISGTERAGTVEGVSVHHAGTTRDGDGTLRTNGGRVLAITAVAPDLVEARRRAYEGASLIDFDGVSYRRDIALEATKVPPLGVPERRAR